MLEFYRWLMRWAEKQTHKHVNCNVKCSQCSVWSSAVQGEITDRYTWGYEYTCGQCGFPQLYNAVAFPFPYPCDDEGNPQ